MNLNKYENTFACIDTVAGIFVDAFAADDNGNLLFMSFVGRDSNVMELNSRIQLSEVDSLGISVLRFREVGDGNAHGKVFQSLNVGNPKALQKTTGRITKTIFGNLVHCWVYNPVMQKPDFGSKSAWIVTPHGQSNPTAIDDQVWGLIKTLSPIPLQEQWREGILKSMFSELVTDMATSDAHHKCRPFNCTVKKVQLNEQFEAKVCDLLKDHKLEVSY